MTSNRLLGPMLRVLASSHIGMNQFALLNIISDATFQIRRICYDHSATAGYDRKLYQTVYGTACSFPYAQGAQGETWMSMLSMPSIYVTQWSPLLGTIVFNSINTISLTSSSYHSLIVVRCIVLPILYPLVPILVLSAHTP